MAVVSAYQIKPILQAHKSGQSEITSSADLGVTTCRVVIAEEGCRFPGGLTLSWPDAAMVAKEERKCFLLEPGSLREIRVFSQETGWVRSLCPTRGAPTMLVSGIPMHRIKETEPMADTLTKIRALGQIRGKVLDTATGLGYTAIEAAKPADEVVTIELDPAAIEVARMNPWSAQLFKSRKIKQIIGDAFEEVANLPSDSFSAIIHDPPTIQFAGELYSAEFYIELRRILRRGGKLFHYVGDPKSAHGSKVTQGVLRRLSDAGFKRTERRPEAFGVLAFE